MPIFKTTFKSIYALIKRKPLSTADIISQSGKFDADWYLQTYADVAKDEHWAANPISHFILLGSKEGRQPNPWFDTKWYKQHYPDVAQSGINPLLHYIQHGAEEGRKPNKRQFIKSTLTTVNDTADIRRRLSLHLWGGLSEPALAALEQIYSNTAFDNRRRWLACWHASRWYYFIGDFAKALQLGQLLLELDYEQAPQKEGVLLRAFCHLELSAPLAAREELQAYVEANPDDSDGYFSLANTYLDDDVMRLQLINKVYSMHGYQAISLLDETKPLTLANVSASAPFIADTPYTVSIIMPVYNAEQHLHTAVNSLLRQSWQNIEIIIVDDCSTDGTFALATQLAKQDARIVALQQAVNSGAYAARNVGLKVATGDFITTHDSDDWSHPQKLATQLAYFASHPKIMGLCSYWIRVRHEMFFTQNWRPNNALTHWSHSSFMFRRQVIEDIGGWDEVRVGGDTEFIWRMKARYGAASYAQIQKKVPLAFALDDQSSLTRTKATHVRTVYFGLRNIYREICAWWHRNATDLHIDHIESRKAVPIPVAMQYRDGRSTEVDILLVSDFSNENMSLPCLDFVQKNPQLRFGLMHWPDFTVPPGSLKESYFKAISAHSALPVASGEQLLCKHIVVAAGRLLQYPVESFPHLLSTPQCWLLTDGGIAVLPESSFMPNYTPVTATQFSSELQLNAS